MRQNKNLTLFKALETKNGLKCEHCGKVFKYESEKRRHEQSHSRQFACKVCNKKFSFMSALRRHEKQHERTGSVCCEHCQRKFRDDSLLKRHIKYAHKGTFICDKCNAVFNSDLALRAHTKIHKPESERKYRCSFIGCSKTFNFLHHLKHHQMTHTNTKQHYCSVCGKGFIQYHHLKSHLNTHKPESRLPCSYLDCKKSFTTIYALRKHIPTHSVNENTDVHPKTLTGTEYIKSDPVIHEDGGQPQLQQDEKDNISFNDRSGPHNNICQRENEELTMLQKISSIDLNEEIPISNCNSSLGECIMGDNADGIHKCLCAQIQSTNVAIEDTYEFISNKKCNPPIRPEIKTTDDQDLNINNNSCDDCVCKNYNLFNKNNEENNMDAVDNMSDIIDYKTDGTVRIKLISDIDVQPISLTNSNNSIISMEASENIPFNSCKAVLGTCIVSGNGTIGEGCLCAKMAMDDHQILDQEINEITPCPNT